jgi:NADH:ubiquinone oxidoreductase subunit
MWRRGRLAGAAGAGHSRAAVLALRGQGFAVLERIFTWWNGATFGTLWTIGQRAVLVGEDENGNKFYEERKVSLEGRKRRHVVYQGLAEASRITPDWHGWLHHTYDEPPTIAPLKRRAWEKDHVPNMTGTVKAYRPPGSLARGGERAKATGDYEPWQPD